MNLERKLGKLHTGFIYPWTYAELIAGKRTLLTTKGWALLEALLKKALTEESPAITFTIADAKRTKISHPTLARCREELQTAGLIAVTRASTDTPFVYKLLDPRTGSELPATVQRKKVRQTLTELYPVRKYTPEESLKVIECLIRIRQKGLEVDHGWEPAGNGGSHRYFCPFHLPDLNDLGCDKKKKSAPLMVFANTGRWICTWPECRHYSKHTLAARGGDGGVVHFVRAYKWQMDLLRYQRRATTKLSHNLIDVQIREVIAQILGGACLADLTYTTQNEAQELTEKPFDPDARRLVKPDTNPLAQLPLIRRRAKTA